MKKGVKIDNNRLKKLKLFAPYEGKSKFSISFNKKIREQLKTCRKARIVKLLKDSGEDYILCYPIKIDGEDGCDVCNKSASISQIKMLECILNFIISTGKDNGVDDITARVYLRQTLDNIIDYVYRVG